MDLQTTCLLWTLLLLCSNMEVKYLGIKIRLIMEKLTSYKQLLVSSKVKSLAIYMMG